MNISIFRNTAILAAGVVLAACASMPPGGDPVDLDGTAWVLSSLPGRSLLPDVEATARFEGGRVQGTDGCNRYTAPYTTKGSSLQVGAKGPTTRMACPPAVMRQAEAFIGALARAGTYRVVDGQLQLASTDGTVLATLSAQPRSLAGTSWRVTGYNNGKQAVVGVLAGTGLTMAFSTDGKVSGSAGCNNFTAPYSGEGQTLALGPVATTRKICATPDRVMEQEQQFLQALATAASARFEGRRLELRTATGALAVALVREGGG